MDDLNKIDYTRLKDLPVVKKFYSKRNRVFLSKIETNKQIIDVVVKQCVTSDRAQQEFTTLRYLKDKGVKVPTPYGCYKNVILMEFINSPLLTYLLDNTTLIAQTWIKKLAYWFWKLHNITVEKKGLVMLKGDVNLRNFLFSGNDFYGIDFEKKVVGFPEHDIGQCCAFILANEPAFDANKFLISKELIHQYLQFNCKITKNDIKKEILLALGEMAERREEQRGVIKKQLEYIKYCTSI